MWTTGVGMKAHLLGETSDGTLGLGTEELLGAGDGVACGMDLINEGDVVEDVSQVWIVYFSDCG